MKPTIEILISSPLSGSEAAALRDLLIEINAPALILANFEIAFAGSAHEIDFVVITGSRAELIELKNITAPVKGGVNGPWQIETSPGLFVTYPGQNPWEQARDAKLALSDAMHEYAKTRAGVPAPTKRRYYEQFDASVTVYPALVAGSKVGAGNYKAWVRSFPDTAEALNSKVLPVGTTWAISHWRQFAIDYLGLMPASLSEAIDPAVFRANQAVTEYSVKLRYSEIAALLPATEKEFVGQNVIDKLRSPANALLLARSGLGKSFHLEHYRRECFEFDEVPILLHCRYYQRDLQKAIFKSIAPYTSLSPAELLDAAKKLGRRPVLTVDGWNDCPVLSQSDLGNDLSAFQLRYNARLIVASQAVPHHELFAEAVKVEIASLRDDHKRAIFVFHSGMQSGDIPAHCYQHFSTAFDLAVAGRCQSGGVVAKTRAELYESYVRSVVPLLSARAVVRKLAWYMGENLKPVLLLSDFERLVEQFVREMGLSLFIADQLLHCRLFEVDRETVAFEHELLKEHFRAEQLLTTPEHLPTQLARPKCAGLTEFVIPSLRDETIVRELLSNSGHQVLHEAFRGDLGTVARNLVREECFQPLARCRDQLSEVNVEPSIGEFDDGRKFVSAAHVVGSTCVSNREKNLCSVIASNLADDLVVVAFLELLELSEWALKEASERAGRANAVKAKAIFRELVQHNVIQCHSDQVHPILFLCHQVRQGLAFGSRLPGISPIRRALLTRLNDGSCGTLGLLVLMSELRYGESVSHADILTIARQAWDTGCAHMEVLDFIHSNARTIRDAGAEAEAAATDLLETFDVKDNIFLSTIWLETRCLFSGFETGIDFTSAVEEFRRILAAATAGDDALYQLERESNPSLGFVEFAGAWAFVDFGQAFRGHLSGSLLRSL